MKLNVSQLVEAVKCMEESIEAEKQKVKELKEQEKAALSKVARLEKEMQTFKNQREAHLSEAEVEVAKLSVSNSLEEKHIYYQGEARDF